MLAGIVVPAVVLASRKKTPPSEPMPPRPIAPGMSGPHAAGAPRVQEPDPYPVDPAPGAGDSFGALGNISRGG